MAAPDLTPPSDTTARRASISNYVTLPESRHFPAIVPREYLSNSIYVFPLPAGPFEDDTQNFNLRVPIGNGPVHDRAYRRIRLDTMAVLSAERSASPSTI